MKNNLTEEQQPKRDISQDDNAYLRNYRNLKEMRFESRVKDHEQFSKLIEIVINCFDTQDRRMILYTLAGYSENKIAEMLGIKQREVSRQLKSIISLLTKMFNEDDEYYCKYFISVEYNKINISFAVKNQIEFDVFFKEFLPSIEGPLKIESFDIRYSGSIVKIELPFEAAAFEFLAALIMTTDNNS